MTTIDERAELTPDELIHICSFAQSGAASPEKLGKVISNYALSKSQLGEIQRSLGDGAMVHIRRSPLITGKEVETACRYLAVAEHIDNQLMGYRGIYT